MSSIKQPALTVDTSSASACSSGPLVPSHQFQHLPVHQGLASPFPAAAEKLQEKVLTLKHVRPNESTGKMLAMKMVRLYGVTEVNEYVQIAPGKLFLEICLSF